MANTTPTFTIDPASPLWRHVKILEHVPGGGTCIWICPGCDVQYTSSYSRVKGHLCAIPGKGIKACPGKDKVPIPVSKIAAYIKEQEEADARIESRYGHPLLKTKGRGSQRSRASSSQSYTPSAAPDIVVESHPFMMRNEDETSNPKRARGPLEMAFGNDYRDIADEAIARCLYANGLSFNVVRSPYWQDMIRKINEAPKGYTGPGYEKVRTTLLTKEVKHIKASLAPIKASRKETGVSIISDGWKDAKNRPLINVIAMSPKGAMFLKAVDCEGEVKDAQFIANILIECINEAGPQNVVQVVTDNAKNCRAAGMLVEKQFPHIFWTPCAVHSLNLMLQKLGTKIAWIKQVYDEAQDIQMFITNHHFSQAIFRSFSRLELLKVAETRFASNTIVLRRLVKVREALSSMVISHQWNTWRQSNNERAIDIRRRILDESWWSRAEYLLSFTEPILGMIRFTDMDKPCLGEVYDGIDSMIENMRSIINAKEQDPEETFFKEVQFICVERWNKMTTPLHLLAFSLSPKYYSEEVLALPTRVPPYRDAEVGEGARKAISKLFPDIEMEDAVTSEFADFVSSKGHTLAAIRDKYRKDAHSWWYLNGHKSPNLQILAIKILSQLSVPAFSGFFGILHEVPEGHVGVYWRGGALSKTITDPGFHLKIPFLTRYEPIQVTIQTDEVKDIPCGTKGGVMIFFDKIEVVNRLRKDYVYETMLDFGVTYDKTWIYDKIHHEINQFCSAHTLQDVYIDMFDQIDEKMKEAIQNDCTIYAPGIEIIGVRVTKPKIPEAIARNYEQMEEERTKSGEVDDQEEFFQTFQLVQFNVRFVTSGEVNDLFLIEIEKQKVAEKEAETQKLKAVTEAEKDAHVSKILMEQRMMEKESIKLQQKIENEMYFAQEKSIADSNFYKFKKEAEANKLLLTPAYLELKFMEAVANDTKIVFGDKVPNMVLDQRLLQTDSKEFNA